MGLRSKIQRFLRQHRFRKHKIPAGLWHQTLTKMPLVAAYSHHDRMRLRLLAGEILHQKHIQPVQGFVLSDEIAVMIAIQVAIVIFGLENPDKGTSLDWLRNWRVIVVYPAAFDNQRETLFNAQGLLVSLGGVEAGETSYQGGIVIDWQDNQPHLSGKHANQVLMHEMAHKLDMLDGDINGHPPLHANMSDQAWYEVFEGAYEDLNQQLKRGKETDFNPYAATSPAEFFAVATEYFFEAPQVLKKLYPLVYEQLSQFYRQNP